MISEGLKDWSNNCWKFSYDIIGIKYILKYIKIENTYLFQSLYYIFADI